MRLVCELPSLLSFSVLALPGTLGAFVSNQKDATQEHGGAFTARADYASVQHTVLKPILVRLSAKQSVSELRSSNAPR